MHRPEFEPFRRSIRLTILLAAGLACDRHEPQPLATADLIGDEVCLQCHTAFDGYLATAHNLSSALPSSETIHGSFESGENVLTTANPYLHFQMEERDGGFFQVAVQGPDSAEARVSERFGIVVGSGRKGQTYLYWRNDRLFQLPVSYWTGIGWANSPGYRDGVANFDRPVNPRCLECHATYAEAVPGPGAANQYDTSSVVLGISCESCHGPGREHVEAESASWRWLRPSFITNPADLPRDRRVDGCALCHGGIGESVRPPFSYTPGEPLSAYLHQPEPPPNAAVDVHGNQVALLARSPCFINSEMTCSTCHDVHRQQRQVGEFSAVCTTCHTPGEAISVSHGAAMPGNCVDCHMPELPTNVIVADGAGGVLRPRVRTHWITVYDGASPNPAAPLAGP